MPYKSLAQERFFNANREKLERQGVDVGEWNAASKGLSLPRKVSHAKAASSPRRVWKGAGGPNYKAGRGRARH